LASKAYAEAATPVRTDRARRAERIVFMVLLLEFEGLFVAAGQFAALP
jgi:hypothetical protein